MVKMEVKGMQQTLSALQDFPAKFVNQAVKPTLKTATKDIVVRDAKRIVSLESTQTGLLGRSIRVRTAKGHNNKRLPRGVVGFAATSVKTKTIDAYYAKWVFANRKLRDGTIRKGTRALRRGLYDNRRPIFARVSGELKRGLPAVVRKARIEAARKRLTFKG
mgnify:CR=1 FL=1